jgi:sulfatase modifying factor 1
VTTFISYSNHDSTIVDLLDSTLQGLGVATVRDRNQMRGGGNWRDSMLPLIATSEQFLLLWSKSAEASRCVQIELGRAFEDNLSIIVVSLDDTPVPGHIADNQIFALSSSGDGLDDIVDAIIPLPQRGAALIPGDYRSAIASLRRSLDDRSSVYQVLYPDEERPTRLVIPLGIVEGLGEDIESETPAQVGDLLRPRDHREQVVLVGHPGSGKSTTLRLLAHRLLRQSSSSSLPILLRCIDYRPKRHQSFEDFIYHSLRDQTSREVAEILKRERLAQSPTVTLLLDGIDELQAGAVESFVPALEHFLEDPATEIERIIITSRVDAFRALEGSFSGWRRVSLQPLTDKQLHQFVHSWFSDEQTASQLLLRLDDRRMAELASRPFLLALICLVYARGGDLGPNRSELYAKAVSYLERRHADAVSEFAVVRRREIFQDLALKSLQLGVLEVDKWLAAGIAASRIANTEGDQTGSFIELTDELDESSRAVGILQSALGKYSFVHRSFQEFLASRALLRSPNGEGIILEYAKMDRWEEPVRLFIGGLQSAEAQARMLRALWQVNQALTLRALTDATRVPTGFAVELLRNTEVSDRVRMLISVRASLADTDASTRKRLVFETVEPILTGDASNEVIYNAVSLVKWVDPTDDQGILWRSFGRHARVKRELLMADPSAKLLFVDLPGGTFIMGDDESIDEVEQPTHEVTLSPFSVAKFQLTNKAFDLITERRPELRSQVAPLDGQPVVGLSWFDAAIVALRVGCRLPTEAEWEYAARAGSQKSWCFGDDETMLGEYANYEGGASRGHPWEVGTGKPNAFDLYDVHGNVWEWCSDWLAPYRRERVTDPAGPEEGTARVRRGGGHSYHARGCRSAFRWGNDPAYSFKDIGVRLVLDKDLVERGW